MAFWTLAPVADAPKEIISGWAILQLPDGVRHLAGYSELYREGRTSSAVREFDVEQLKAVTRSGRVYKLVGAPGMGAEAQYVWASWCRINGVENYRDVSGEIVAQRSSEYPSTES